jgi:uncharacterized protein YkwD
MNKRIILILILLLFCTNQLVILAQDSYYSYTTENFRKQEIFQDTIDLINPDQARLNAVIFYMTNEERKKKKLSEVKYHPKLEEAAVIHSESMVKYDFFSHINKRSKKLHDPNARARSVGITNPFIAENIIETFVLEYTEGDKVYPGKIGEFRYKLDEDPIKSRTYISIGEVMLRAWMDSPDHRENILSKKAVQLGCGTAFYVKNDFNGMPAVIATQNFQLYEPLRVID